LTVPAGGVIFGSRIGSEQARRRVIDMPHRQEVEVLLAVWREVERALNEAPAGSREAERLQAEAARLRDEYRSLLEEAQGPREPGSTAEAASTGRLSGEMAS
jgi:hypothetical protein